MGTERQEQQDGCDGTRQRATQSPQPCIRKDAKVVQVTKPPCPDNAGHSQSRREALQPPADATRCQQPKAGNNEGPPIRDQLSHTRLHASLPRELVGVEEKPPQLVRLPKNLRRLYKLDGLYVENKGWMKAGRFTAMSCRIPSIKV